MTIHATPIRVADQAITPDEIAASAFLVRYPDVTRAGYKLCLRQWFNGDVRVHKPTNRPTA